MLSFEISAIDIVLMVVVLILLVLLIAQKRSQSVVEPWMSMNPQKSHSGELEVREEAPVENTITEQSGDGFRGCVHWFGHLRGMAKNTAVPDECFGCPKVLGCMFGNE